MKIASWNVNSIKARLDHVKTWLTDNEPDVLLLQELKGLEFPADEIEALGYETAAVPQKAYNGVAAICKKPFTIIAEKLPGFEDDEQARYIEIEMDGVRVIGIYAPNGNPVDTDKFTYKLKWLNHLKDHLIELKQKEIPVVLGGDFNIIPEDIDCHDPKAWKDDALFRPESRQLWRSMVNIGYYDAYRIVNAGVPEYTFWDYQAGAWPQNKGIRIDHFLLSPQAADKMVNCTIDKTPRGFEKPSDHTPIIVEIAL
jgi:exodeoxyribonuclease-3